MAILFSYSLDPPDSRCLKLSPSVPLPPRVFALILKPFKFLKSPIASVLIASPSTSGKSLAVQTSDSNRNESRSHREPKGRRG